MNLLNFVEHQEVPSPLITLDTEKALDSIHCGYLPQVPMKHGLSGYIQPAIMALYTSLSACFYTEDMLSQSFHITNGTHQECPLSPLIFALKPLVEKIKPSPRMVKV